MNREFGISGMEENLRVSRDLWPAMVSQAMVSGSTKSNPRTVTERDIEELLAGF